MPLLRRGKMNQQLVVCKYSVNSQTQKQTGETGRKSTPVVHENSVRTIFLTWVYFCERMGIIQE